MRHPLFLLLFGRKPPLITCLLWCPPPPSSHTHVAFLLLFLPRPFYLAPFTSLHLHSSFLLSFPLPFHLTRLLSPPSEPPPASQPAPAPPLLFIRHVCRQRGRGRLRESKSLFTTVTHYKELHSGKTNVSSQYRK